MDPFIMEVAGAVVSVRPLFQSTKEYCRAYLSDREPDFFVQVTAEDLCIEQERLEQEAIEKGLKIRKFQDPFLERTTIQNRVADFLLCKNTLMMHGSTVSVDCKAYLFAAPCGTGKSTHTRLWRELFGQRAIMVNDDKPFLQITSSGVLAYGSPWSGKHGLASNVCVPLRGICSLQRGKENSIHRIQPESLVHMLRQQVYVPNDSCLSQKAFSLVNTLAKTVPLWTMQCNKELDAAKVAYAAMHEDSE